MPPIDHRCPAVNPEVIGHGRLGAHHVPDRHHGEPRAPGPAVVGVGRRRSGRSLAPTQDVGAHHEPTLGVQGAARTDEGAPPPRRRVAVGELTGGMAVAGERVANQQGVVMAGRQLAPRLVGDDHALEQAAALEREGPVGRVGDEPAVSDRVAGTPRAGHRQGAGVRPPEPEVGLGHGPGCGGGPCRIGRVYGSRHRRLPAGSSGRTAPGASPKGHGHLVAPVGAASPVSRDGTLAVRTRLPGPAPKERCRS
jgi:hypothetical protein